MWDAFAHSASNRCNFRLEIFSINLTLHCDSMILTCIVGHEHSMVDGYDIQQCVTCAAMKCQFADIHVLRVPRGHLKDCELNVGFFQLSTIQLISVYQV